MDAEERIPLTEASELGDIVARLRRRVGGIVLAVLIVAGGALAISLARPKVYVAQAVVVFDHSDELSQRLFGQVYTGQATPAQQAATDRALASLPVVARYAARLLGHGLTGPQVSSRIQIVQPDQSSTLGLQASAPTPTEAARIANAFAQALIAYELSSERAQISAVLAALRRQRIAVHDRQSRAQITNKLLDLQLMASAATGGVQLAQAALPPTAPSSPTPVKDGLIGAFAGLLLGLFVALVADSLDRRLRAPDDVRRVSELPILASVPDEKALRRERVPVPPPRTLEAMRLLHSRLRHSPRSGSRARSLLVTSAAPATGKTTVAWYLAVAAAEAGERVVVVEADLRKPDLAQMMGLDEAAGLSNLLSGPPASALDYVRPVELPSVERAPQSAEENGAHKSGANGNGAHRNGDRAHANGDSGHANGADEAGSARELARVLELARLALQEPPSSATRPPGADDAYADAILLARLRLAASVRELERSSQLDRARPDLGLTTLDVLFAGPPTHRASRLLGSERMAEVIHELVSAYDLVIVDTPPIVLVSDGIPLCKRTDGVVVITRISHDTAHDVRALGRELEAVGVTPLGIVVNGVASSGVGYYAVREGVPELA